MSKLLTSEQKIINFEQIINSLRRLLILKAVLILAYVSAQQCTRSVAQLVSQFEQIINFSSKLLILSKLLTFEQQIINSLSRLLILAAHY